MDSTLNPTQIDPHQDGGKAPLKDQLVSIGEALSELVQGASGRASDRRTHRESDTFPGRGIAQPLPDETLRPADLKNDRFPSKRASLAKRASRALARQAGNVIVAGAGLAQLVVQLRLGLETRRPGQRDVHDALEHLPDVGSRQPVVAMTTLLHQHEQPGRKQLAEVTARRLRRYAGGECKLGRSERTPAEQDAQDIGACRIADQCSNFRHLGCIRHASNMRVAASNYHRQCFVRDRSKSGGRRRHA
jgi:hypothetical protein